MKEQKESVKKPDQFDEEKEYADFIKTLQEEIDRFSLDAENRTLYLHLREEERPESIEHRIKQGESLSGGEKAQERYDKDSLKMFEWSRHFWTSRDNFLKIAKFLGLSLIPEPEPTKEEAEENERMEFGRIESYRTNIPYLCVNTYRAYRNRNIKDLEGLTQIKFNFALENGEGLKTAVPKEFRIDTGGLLKAAKEINKFKEQWQKEFGDDLWRKTSILKLWKLESFNETLLGECGNMLANYGGFTIMTSNEEGFNIVHIKCWGFHKGSILDWEPLTYEELLDTLYENFQRKDIVQEFVGKWYSNWIYIPAEWLPKIRAILQEPITDEEYKKIDEIVEEGKKKTAVGWLGKAKAAAQYERYSWAEEYLKKAKAIWPEIDSSEIEKIINEKKYVKR